MDLGLRDRACIVTGASRGIGGATAVALAREGAGVLLVGRSEDTLGRVAAQARDAGGRGEALALDVTDPAAAERSLPRGFADAYAGQGVLVTAVAPGPVGSELWVGEGGLADQMAQAHGITREEALEAAASRVPIGRLGTEQEIAAVIVFLCS